MWDLEQNYIKDKENYVAISCDIPFINKYIEECEASKIDTRILLCSTEKTNPHFDISLEFMEKHCNFLGFDYAYPSDDFYSAIKNDIERFSEFNCCVLNQNGLFNSLPEAEEFVEIRECLKNKFPLKFEVGELILYKLWQVNLERLA